MRILIVDDDEEMCEELREILEDEGYSVHMVNAGDKAEAMIRENDYNIVLLDLKIPGINGYEVLKYLKTQRPDTKIIILTGAPLSEMFLQEGTREESLSNGHDHKEGLWKLADDVMQKPFEIEELLLRIRELTEE